MASLALGVGGAAAGAAIGSFFPVIGTISGALIGQIIGGAIGGTAGSFIDSQFLFPAIFGKSSPLLQGPKISDVSITSGEPGSGINFCLGRETRVNGTVIWLSPVTQVPHENAVGGKGGGNVISYEYFMSVAIGICEGPISDVIKVWADGKLIYDKGANTNGGKDIRYTDLIIYNGTQTTPDPTIQGVEIPLGFQVPAFVNTAYIVIVGLHIHDWGNRVPNFNFLVQQSPQTKLSDAVSAIWTRGGRPGGDIDTTWIADKEVRGYFVSGPVTIVNQLEPVMLAFDLVAQQINGVVQFRHRKDSQVVMLDASKMAAQAAGGSDPVRAIKINERSGFDLPKMCNVSYYDPDLFWQKSSQRWDRMFSVSPVVTSIDLPLVMAGADARALAKRIVWAAQAERADVELTLAPSQVQLIESDLIQVTVDGATTTFRISSITHGQDYVYQVQGSTEQTSVLTQTASTTVPIVQPPTSPEAPMISTLVIMEIPVLPQDSYGRGLHLAASRANAGDTWHPAFVYAASDPAATDITDGYGEIYVVKYESTIGICTEVLAANGPIGLWDLTTTLTITMFNPALGLQTQSDTHLWKGFNHMYIGKADGTGEVIAFSMATNTAPGVYQINRILRGRLGTEERMGAHVAGEFAVLLDPISPKFVPYSEDTGQTVYYKARPEGGPTLNLITPISAFRSARSVTPWSPSQVTGSRDASGNLMITWIRRCNRWFVMFGMPNTAPNPFSTEEYEVQIYTAFPSTLVRTARMNGNWGDGVPNSYVYTLAQQAADGTTGVQVFVQIYQINRNLGLNSGKGIGSAVIQV